MAAQGGFGVNVEIFITSALATIVGVADVDFPEQDRIIVDITSHDSVNGYAEKIPTGKNELTEFNMTLFWDDTEASHAQILTEFGTDEVQMSIADPDGDETITFQGIIKTIGRIGRIDDAFKARITVTPTGAPTIT